MAFRILLAALLVLGGGLYSRYLDSHHVASPGLPDLTIIPREIEGWRSRDVGMTAAVEDVLRADRYLFREYRSASGAAVSLFVAYFVDQQVGAQIHSPRNCLPGAGWHILSTEKTAVTFADGPQDVARLVLDRNGARQEALYWFTTRSGMLTSEYALKFDLVMNSLRGRPTDAAFVRYMSSGRDEPAMRELMSRLEEPIDRSLRGVGLP